ncbi:hypothetical protein BVY02_01015 [bacterium J17]|nr:hypothetical protein BVY02_01015 [bacterium J17]
MKNKGIFLALFVFSACSAPLPFNPVIPPLHVPSSDYAHAARAGKANEYTIFNASATNESRTRAKLNDIHRSQNADPRLIATSSNPNMDNSLLAKGFVKKGSIDIPSPNYIKDGDAVLRPVSTTAGQHPLLPPSPPAGSSSPYHTGQMTANPSLWPDEGQGSDLFRDFRAFQPMDLITIIVNENSEGKKEADTETGRENSVLAGISSFFGLETSIWAANNEALNPAQLIQANTTTEFEGEGETERKGTLRAKISAVIMEILPNGLMRVEGTKIISVNQEEEVMVISGLVRMRDISSMNEVDSGRIANMRIDFYGRGLINDQQSPGWGSRVFDWIWPF